MRQQRMIGRAGDLVPCVRGSWAWCASAMCLVLLGIGLAQGEATAQEGLAGSSPITEAWTRLESEELGLAERAAAATELLEMRNSEATGALSLALTSRQSRVGWRAVIQAVATFPDDPPMELSAPLIGLLGQADKALVEDLAAALGRFDQSEVIKQLSRIARDSRAPVAQRRGAILTLGHDRTTQTAGLLMELTNPGQPEAVQQSAFVALGTLSALDHYDADRQAWSSWWEKNKGLWAKEWTQHLLENFERRESRRSARDHQIEDKLLDSQRALYKANSPDDRPSVLVYMLRDPLTPIRRLGMELTRQRLLDDLPFEEPLREALRGRLTDPAPDIRKDAALRLRDLADAPASERVAKNLSEKREQVPSVLRAYLLMITRLPQAQAVDPAVEFLNDEALRADAAAVLAAAFDEKLMKKSQVNRAAKLARKYLVGDQPPAPQVITLMGKVGNKDDWKRIAGWVDHPKDPVKQAAAQAWSDSSRPLNHLADRVTDPIIQPILIAAATRRGTEPYTLRILTAHRPQRERSAEAWRVALVTMAQRVPADAVLATDRQLAESGESSQGLRLDVLSSAIDREQPESLDLAERLGLLLSRGELLVETGDPSAALADLLTVSASESELNESQRDRLGRSQIRASLLIGQIDEAFAIARKLLGTATDRSPRYGISPTDDRIIAQFIQTAQRLRRENRKDAVATIARELRNLLEPAIKPEVGQQLAILEAWVHGSSNPPRLSHTDNPDANEVEQEGNGPVAE